MLVAALLALAISAPQSIGSYASGCIASAEALKPAISYQITHVSRKRYYGHKNLVDFIEDFSNKVYAKSGKTVLIGDLSQQRGGLMTSGHASHQNGLDVDIWFELGERELSAAELDNYIAPNLVNEDFTINPDLWQPDFLKLASENPEVERIFVNAAIKKKLCDDYKGKEWLRKIRPWWHHKDHMHVRLYCPEGNASCTPQDPLTPGDGCDKSLDWWLTPEATKPLQKPKSTISKPAKLPKECKAIMIEKPVK